VSFLYFAFQNKNNDHATNGEFWLMRQINRIHSPKIVFDVGGNVGDWSLGAGSVFKNGVIWTFEPIPDVFRMLETNVVGKDFIRPFNLALSDKIGVLNFNYYPNANLFNSVYEHFKGGVAVKTEVNCIDGDSFCMEHNINEIDFLKLDVEGSEHLVLKGFSHMLQNQKIKIIQFEYGIFSIESKFLLKDYFQLFSEYGYLVGKVYPNYVDFTEYNWSLENFLGANYVAVRQPDKHLIDSLK